MTVVAFADQVDLEAEAVDVQLRRLCQCYSSVRGVLCVVDTDRAANLAGRGDALDREGQDVRIEVERTRPAMLNLIGQNSTPRKSLTRLSRITEGVTTAFPLTIAASASRWASFAVASTTPAKIQLPSAMTLPERMTSANFSPSSLVLP